MSEIAQTSVLLKLNQTEEGASINTCSFSNTHTHTLAVPQKVKELVFSPTALGEEAEKLPPVLHTWPSVAFDLRI